MRVSFANPVMAAEAAIHAFLRTRQAVAFLKKSSAKNFHSLVPLARLHPVMRVSFANPVMAAKAAIHAFFRTNKAVAFLKKSSAKNFCSLVPLARLHPVMPAKATAYLIDVLV